ncbi:MAG: PIN domain-containing protein [Bifidobacteriaceae bacterium]|jgi:predicted nucleic acid-binding protein|nr:PIN domain-containing protein [Bifidobacteriaceae bacterium]
MFSAFLDANVLVPISLADTVLRCAEVELFYPLWSETVLNEVEQAISKVESGMAPARVIYRISHMEAAFPEASVKEYRYLEESIRLPDPDDRHVVAAAFLGGADIIVTSNLKDFPPTTCDLYGLEVVTPDNFLQDMFDLAPEVVRSVIWQQAQDSRRPPMSIDDVLASLERAGAPGFVREFRVRVQ